MKHRIKRRLGFTLIELVVVILILGILATVVVPRVVGRASDAKRAKAKTDIATISGLLQQFRLDCDRFPTTQEGLQSLNVAPGDARGWKGPYATKGLPTDPWGNPYYYEYPGAAGKESYTLLSYGSDGVPGGDGDAADISEDSSE